MPQAKAGVMKRTLSLPLLVLGVGTRAPPPLRAQDLIDGARAAMGGVDSLRQVNTLVVKGTARHWEPEHSIVAGGEMRHAADSMFEMTGDFTAHAVRVDWVKNFVYPTPRTFQFGEIVTPYDKVWGDSTYDLMLADWRRLGGVRIATSQRYEFNGRVVADIKITDKSANLPLPAGHFEVPAALQATAPKPTRGWGVRTTA